MTNKNSTKYRIIDAIIGAAVFVITVCVAQYVMHRPMYPWQVIALYFVIIAVVVYFGRPFLNKITDRLKKKKKR